MRDTRVRSFMWSLGYSGCFAVSSNGLGGGLGLFWLSSVSISLQGFSNRCIDTMITSEGGVTWRASFVYGEPKRDLRHEFWDLLRSLRSTWNGPWICCGDFNEALSQDEHQGPRARTDAQIRAFQDCLHDCNLLDLGYDGPKFTWTNRQEANANIRVRLDRAVANGEFRGLFEDCTVENIMTTSSDHYAILVSLTKDSRRTRVQPMSHSFRYEAMWRKAPDYKEVLESAWSAASESAPSLRSTWNNLNRMAPMLKDWSRTTFGSIHKQIRKLEQ
ncbi:uncharacterized protein [Lolium perenne]|uniref:uncharacterized protein n=1 Tax=Lolium perenne TaxID=4522 RepID=UPI003A99530D